MTVTGSYGLGANNARRRSYYRVKLNLGSVISGVDFKNWENGELILEFTEGDICKDEKRYSSKIKFICNKTANFITDIEIIDTSDGNSISFLRMH